MRILLILCLCLLLGGTYAQKLDHRLGYMIVQVEKKSFLPDILGRHSSRHQSEIRLDRTLSARLGIYLLAFDHSRVHQGKLLDQLRSDRKVKVAQYDHITSLRAIPDDPRFPDQWQWLNTGQTGGLIDADIDADLAWDISRGGLTALGDTIVVAIIDDGLGYTHQDIAANTWINYGEIRDNGIDEDENGYIDDVYGWNAYEENPDVFNQGHGLSVAGMIGAVGNNGIGITGLNWNVKLMTIVGGSPESVAIASYSYALDQRILYHQSDGERGAFVVATNSSWGIDFGQPADAPLWCAFYDSLGQHGIISAAATANLTIDIDIESDLPTGCPSEYLLSVTALNHENLRTFSAFGLQTVDFGAPGEDIFTTEPGNSYGTTSGTSFASPVAAGLVALLYSAPCLGIAELAHSNPAAGARYIRDLIFNGVEPDPVLYNETRFGGSLNAGNSMILLMSACTDCALPLGFTTDILSDTEVLIDWVTIDTVDGFNARFKRVSDTEWDTILDVIQPLLLTGLTGCTEYQLELESICADSTTGFIPGLTFKTDGCCEIPADIDIVANENSFHASWSNVLAAEYFLVQWKIEGDTEWIEEVTSLNEVTIENLLQCTFYEFRLQTNCDTSETGFSDIITIRTRNCGNCIDLVYCDVDYFAFFEFIDSLVIGSLANQSGFNGGYALFEDFIPDYVAGSVYPVSLWPGFGFFGESDEQFRIWLDANQDGVFETDELLFDSVLLAGDTLLVGELTIPSDARGGSTRMRVSMANYNPPDNEDQEPCGENLEGEVEDYCVNIIRDGNTCPEVDTLLFDAINLTGAFMSWPSADSAIAYIYRYREVATTEYTELATLDTIATLSGLTKCTEYEVQIRTVCIMDTTSYNTIYILETDCDVAVKDEKPLLAAFEVFPNPISDYTFVRLTAIESGDHRISIYNTKGQKINTRKIYAERNSLVDIRYDDFARYPTGLYFIVVEKDGRIATKKVVKI